MVPLRRSFTRIAVWNFPIIKRKIFYKVKITLSFTALLQESENYFSFIKSKCQDHHLSSLHRFSHRYLLVPSFNAVIFIRLVLCYLRSSYRHRDSSPFFPDLTLQIFRLYLLVPLVTSHLLTLSRDRNIKSRLHDNLKPEHTLPEHVTCFKL